MRCKYSFSYTFTREDSGVGVQRLTVVGEHDPVATGILLRKLGGHQVTPTKEIVGDCVLEVERGCELITCLMVVI